MDGLKISEAARDTGFTVSALRFYEKEGVVVPKPTALVRVISRLDHPIAPSRAMEQLVLPRCRVEPAIR